ncbi:hypothetical protein B0J14DRAFT_660040 [Halenospora varia]|nr:hypothetical protein B0J14DRAFT_660040 [Halenospora varia]
MSVDLDPEMNSRKRLGGGKPRDYYHKFCQKAHQHRSVFDMFPNTNEYVSIFCDSIKTLIKASVNYIQISEGLLRAFDEITERVDFAKRQVGGVLTQYTRIALAKLYKEIFLYLKDCTDWFLRTTRALRSFNEDFYKCVSDRMERIKSIAATVHQEATIGGIQSIQIMLARTEDLEQQRRRHWEDEMAHWRMERRQMMQGTVQQQILQSFERKILEILDRAKTQILQPDTILEASKGLEKFIIGSSVDLLNTLQPTPFASTPVATRLREWLSSRISKFL